MTTEAVGLIHQLSTLAATRKYLEATDSETPGEAISHIIDFHFQRRATWLRHLETADWLWLHRGFKDAAESWNAELPIDIADHRVSRVDLEEKALRICILRKLAAIAHERAQAHH